MEAYYWPPQCMIFSGIVVAIFLIVLVVFARNYRETKSDSALLCIIISSLMIIAASFSLVLTYSGLNYRRDYNSLEYRVELLSNRTDSEEVYLPVSVSARLQASLRIEEGSGTFTIVESGRGLALKVNFSDHIVISAKVESTDDLGGLNFTLLNWTDELEHEVEYWISYQPHDPSDYFCRFSLAMDYDLSDSGVKHRLNGFLEEGWNVYRGEIVRWIV